MPTQMLAFTPRKVCTEQLSLRKLVSLGRKCIEDVQYIVIPCLSSIVLILQICLRILQKLV